MSKLIALAVIVGAVLIPSAAGATTATKVSGVVVSRSTARHTLVLGSAHGAVSTVRATARQLRGIRLGSRLSVTGTKLADGSIHANQIKRTGMRSRVRIKVTVLKLNGKKLLVAGGGSAFSIRLKGASRGGGAARQDGTAAGHKIDAVVEVSNGGLVEDSQQDDGEAGLIDFSGKVTAIDSGSLTVTDDGVSTVITLPDGFSLPSAVQVGSEVELVASVSNATLTLVEIKLDGDGAENGDDGGSNVGGDAKVHVDGSVTAVGGGTITIQPGDNASPVTFAVPDGFTLPAGLTTGSEVEACGAVVNTVLTLTRLEVQDSGDGSGDGGGGGGDH